MFACVNEEDARSHGTISILLLFLHLDHTSSAYSNFCHYHPTITLPNWATIHHVLWGDPGQKKFHFLESFNAMLHCCYRNQSLPWEQTTKRTETADSNVHIPRINNASYDAQPSSPQQRQHPRLHESVLPSSQLCMDTMARIGALAN